MKPVASSASLFTQESPAQSLAGLQVAELRRELAAAYQREQQLRAQRDLYASLLDEIPARQETLNQQTRHFYATEQVAANRESWMALVQQITDTCSQLIYVRDAQGQLVFHNQAFNELAERSHPAVRPLHLNLAATVEPSEWQVTYQEVMSCQRPVSRLCSYPLANGKMLWYQLDITALPQPDKVGYVLTVATDITEIKKTYQTQAHNEKQGLDLLDFLSSRSQEIRVPMNEVLGMAGLLAKTPLDALQHQHLGTLLASGRSLLATFNDVVDMAKISVGQLELELIAFNLSKAVRLAAQTLACRAAEKNLVFDIQPLQLVELMVLSDPHRLKQVVVNLLANAIELTEQGSVTLGTDVLHDALTSVTIRFWISVSNDKQQLFKAIPTSLDVSRCSDSSSLNLTISRCLVELLGGELELPTSAGPGTRFAFTLTMPKALNQPTSLVSAVPDYVRLRGAHALLAEDSSVNRQLTTLILKKWGMAVDSAVNGPDALALLQTRTYDVVLMDIQMPGMSGVAVTEAIRQHPDSTRANIPIIALTGSALRADREHYLQAGMNDCLIKPFEEVDLYNKLVGQLFPLESHPPVIVAPALEELTPPSKHSQTSPLFDLAQLERNAHGNQEFMRRMIDVFLTEVPVVAASLTAAANTKDGLTLTTLAHKLKSTLKLFQVTAAFDDLLVLEENQATLETRQQAAHRLSNLLKRVCAALQSTVGRG